MSEYVPIDIDDVVHVKGDAALVRVAYDVESWDHDLDEEVVYRDVFEFWLPFEHIEHREMPINGMRTISVSRLWAEREGLCDEYR